MVTHFYRLQVASQIRLFQNRNVGDGVISFQIKQLVEMFFHFCYVIETDDD